MDIIGTGATIDWRGPDQHSHGFEVNSLPVDVRISGSDTVQVTEVDALIDVTADATFNREYQLTINETTVGAFRKGVTTESLTPSIATVSSGRAEYVSDGEAVIRIETPYIRKHITLPMHQYSNAELREFTGWVEGSLGHHIDAAMTAALTGKTVADHMPMYLNDPANPHYYTPWGGKGGARRVRVQGQTSSAYWHGDYVRNPACWAAQWDLSGISPWNTREGNMRAGTAIARDAIIGVQHYRLYNGDVVRFIAMDGTVVDRTIAASAQLRFWGDNDLLVDGRVYRLNEALPASIAHYTIMPDDMTDYLPGVALGGLARYQVPSLCMNQFDDALTSGLWSVGSGASFGQPQTSLYRPWHKTKIDKDSGSAAFLIINGEPVLITTWIGGGGGMGHNYALYATQLNTALAEAGSASTVEIADLSGFTNYGGA